MSITIGFIDNFAFLTARNTYLKVQDSLQALAIKELEWGKRHRAAFDRQKIQWMLSTHRKPQPEELSITLGEDELRPQLLVKWLGVTIDTKLTFAPRVKNQAAKALKAANRLSALARTG